MVIYFQYNAMLTGILYLLTLFWMSNVQGNVIFNVVKGECGGRWVFPITQARPAQTHGCPGHAEAHCLLQQYWCLPLKAYYFLSLLFFHEVLIMKIFNDN